VRRRQSSPFLHPPDRCRVLARRQDDRRKEDALAAPVAAALGLGVLAGWHRDPVLARYVQTVGYRRSPALAVTPGLPGSARVGSCCGQDWWSALAVPTGCHGVDTQASSQQAAPPGTGKGPLTWARSEGLEPPTF
jgi:hypothetical protein